MARKIDHSYTREIVCPYCGCVFSNSGEIEGIDDDLGHIDCERCEHTFTATREISVTYSSYKIDLKKELECDTQNDIWQLEGIKAIQKSKDENYSAVA